MECDRYVTIIEASYPETTFTFLSINGFIIVYTFIYINKIILQNFILIKISNDKSVFKW